MGGNSYLILIIEGFLHDYSLFCSIITWPEELPLALLTSAVRSPLLLRCFHAGLISQSICKSGIQISGVGHAAHATIYKLHMNRSADIALSDITMRFDREGAVVCLRGAVPTQVDSGKQARTSGARYLPRTQHMTEILRVPLSCDCRLDLTTADGQLDRSSTKQSALAIGSTSLDTSRSSKSRQYCWLSHLSANIAVQLPSHRWRICILPHGGIVRHIDIRDDKRLPMSRSFLFVTKFY